MGGINQDFKLASVNEKLIYISSRLLNPGNGAFHHSRLVITDKEAQIELREDEESSSLEDRVPGSKWELWFTFRRNGDVWEHYSDDKARFNRMMWKSRVV